MSFKIEGEEKMRSFLKSFIENKEVKNAGWIIGGRVAQMILSFLGCVSKRNRLKEIE